MAWLVAHTEQYRGQPIRVLEFGSKNVNGSPRTLPTLDAATRYIGVDIEPGADVDIIADAAVGIFPTADLVICTEVLEHTPYWQAIIDNAYHHLHQHGTFLVTAATTPRTPHSATDGGHLRDGEHYENIDPDELAAALTAAGFKVDTLEVHSDRGDLYAIGVKP